MNFENGDSFFIFALLMLLVTSGYGLHDIILGQFFTLDFSYHSAVSHYDEP